MKLRRIKLRIKPKRPQLKKRKMKPGGGKRKGGAHERKVCQRMSLWVTNRARTDVFWRSAMSGGRHTINVKVGRGKETFAHAGDIVATRWEGCDFCELFVVECKHYDEIRMDQLMFGKRGWISGVWDKLVDECAGKREPFAIIRQHWQPEVVLTSKTGYRYLSNGGDLPLYATFPWKGIYLVLLRDVLMLDWQKIASIVPLTMLREVGKPQRMFLKV